MKGRAYVMIFFFWALLTIITPILVSWSQSLKALPQVSNDHQDQKIKDFSPRRMMGYSERMHLAGEFVKPVEVEKKLMMEPSMAPRHEDDSMPSFPIVLMNQQEVLVTKHTEVISLR